MQQPWSPWPGDGLPPPASAADLVVLRPEGLYCPAGDFHIDPWRPVPRAVITHAHADHARAGHGAYLCAARCAALLRARLGDVAVQTLPWGERVAVGGVHLSLHPAGHVLGSAQVRLERAGQVWVVSGDYKTVPDPTCDPFEPQRCHVFVTESTFGLPIYRWPHARAVYADINAWWQANAHAGRPSLLSCYSLGKAQRLLAGVDASIGPIVVHGAVQPLNRAYAAQGVVLPPTRAASDLGPTELRQALLLAPPNAGGWARHLADASRAFASGWMQVRGARRRAGYDRGFVLSDHADWPGLMCAIAATGAQRIIVTHGQVAPMVRHLGSLGLAAQAFETEYGREPAAEEEGVHDGVREGGPP